MAPSGHRSDGGEKRASRPKLSRNTSRSPDNGRQTSGWGSSCHPKGLLPADPYPWGRGKRADQFLTVIYQIERNCRRLLWVGRRRTRATLRRNLKELGPQVLQGLRFVCSDRWQPYLSVIAKVAEHAVHVLDSFHIVQHLNKAVDAVRRCESGRLRDKSIAAKLKKMRWHLLRRVSRVRGQARVKLWGLLASKLATGRAWDLKEAFDPFWGYRTTWSAGAFLDS